MKNNFYKVILRYGHVGKRKEVSVARYLSCENTMKITDVVDLALQMPGVKNNGISEISPINYESYIMGKEEEKDNLYLQQLMSFKSIESSVKN